MPARRPFLVALILVALCSSWPRSVRAQGQPSKGTASSKGQAALTEPELRSLARNFLEGDTVQKTLAEARVRKLSPKNAARLGALLRSRSERLRLLRSLLTDREVELPPEPSVAEPKPALLASPMAPPQGSSFETPTLSAAQRIRALAWIKQLGAVDFDIRETAEAELLKLGQGALPLLKGRHKDPSAERRARLERLDHRLRRHVSLAEAVEGGLPVVIRVVGASGIVTVTGSEDGSSVRLTAQSGSSKHTALAGLIRDLEVDGALATMQGGCLEIVLQKAVRIELPAGVRLSIVGDADCELRVARLHCRSVTAARAGSLSLTLNGVRVDEDVLLRTGQGSLRMLNVKAQSAALETQNGPIRIEGVELTGVLSADSYGPMNRANRAEPHLIVRRSSAALMAIRCRMGALIAEDLTTNQLVTSGRRVGDTKVPKKLAETSKALIRVQASAITLSSGLAGRVAIRQAAKQSSASLAELASKPLSLAGISVALRDGLLQIDGRNTGGGTLRVEVPPGHRIFLQGRNVRLDGLRCQSLLVEHGAALLRRCQVSGLLCFMRAQCPKLEELRCGSLYLSSNRPIGAAFIEVLRSAVLVSHRAPHEIRHMRAGILFVDGTSGPLSLDRVTGRVVIASATGSLTAALPKAENPRFTVDASRPEGPVPFEVQDGLSRGGTGRPYMLLSRATNVSLSEVEGPIRTAPDRVAIAKAKAEYERAVQGYRARLAGLRPSSVRPPSPRSPVPALYLATAQSGVFRVDTRSGDRKLLGTPRGVASAARISSDAILIAHRRAKLSLVDTLNGELVELVREYGLNNTGGAPSSSAVMETYRSFAEVRGVVSYRNKAWLLAQPMNQGTVYEIDLNTRGARTISTNRLDSLKRQKPPGQGPTPRGQGVDIDPSGDFARGGDTLLASCMEGIVAIDSSTGCRVPFLTKRKAIRRFAVIPRGPGCSPTIVFFNPQLKSIECADLVSGEAQVIAGPKTGSGAPWPSRLGAGLRICAAQDGYVYLYLSEGLQILRIDPSTGERTIVSSWAIGARRGKGPEFRRAVSILD